MSRDGNKIEVNTFYVFTITCLFDLINIIEKLDTPNDLRGLKHAICPILASNLSGENVIKVTQKVTGSIVGNEQ